MNSNGKKNRRESGMNRHEIKRATRKKRHEALADPKHDAKIGTNARKAAKRASKH